MELRKEFQEGIEKRKHDDKYNNKSSCGELRNCIEEIRLCKEDIQSMRKSNLEIRKILKEMREDMEQFEKDILKSLEDLEKKCDRADRRTSGFEPTSPPPESVKLPKLPRIDNYEKD